MGLRELFRRRRPASDENKRANGSLPPGASGSVVGLLRSRKTHPELLGFIEDSLKVFGDNPVPKIIQQTLAEGLHAEAQAMASIWLSYIGEPAIPYLIKLLGDHNYGLAVFAAKVLADIEGSLPYVIRALKSEDPNTRLHAAGSLQSFGPEVVKAVPDLCEFIKSEIVDSGGKIPEAAGIAAGTLGRIGKAALPMVVDLLKNDIANVRIVAASAMLRIGKPALPKLIEARSKEKDKNVFVVLQLTIDKIGEVK